MPPRRTNLCKPRSIHFRTREVKAMLEGLKTQIAVLCRESWVPLELGDRLRVKETWRRTHHHDGSECVAFQAGGPYRCGKPDSHELDGFFRWKTPMYMARWQSRFEITVTKITTKRAHALTDDDARKEGLASAAEFEAFWKAGVRPIPWENNPLLNLYEFTWAELPYTRGNPDTQIHDKNKP